MRFLQFFTLGGLPPCIASDGAQLVMGQKHGMGWLGWSLCLLPSVEQCSVMLQRHPSAALWHGLRVHNTVWHRGQHGRRDTLASTTALFLALSHAFSLHFIPNLLLAD
ncbi:hypothetical protein HAX54_025734 [Datura stramonium]|uniref:Secreted protein n=1 Tax=Datura stramonium TaxID=4076 RepID=A0ABS8V225_DATST|nr:hypothetical protein [Datura stramonium]